MITEPTDLISKPTSSGRSPLLEAVVVCVQGPLAGQVRAPDTDRVSRCCRESEHQGQLAGKRFCSSAHMYGRRPRGRGVGGGLLDRKITCVPLVSLCSTCQREKV
jgi:hypothetical protein